MCGIFGFVGKSSWKTSVLLQALCITDEVRGKHSTGIVIQSDRCFLVKRSLRGKEFVAQGHARLLFKKDYGIALGHNRYATSGRINDRNAHPFGVRVNGGWNFGVHNGVVGGVKSIARRYGVGKTSVDSEAAFRAIARLQNRGLDVVDAIDDVTESISRDADFAFAYLNTAENALYLWRSPDRPLVVLDARKLGLGRWFCSTEEIFRKAWELLAGALGDIGKISCFEAYPYRLYRCADDGAYEVEPVRDLRHKPRRKKKTESRYFRCYREHHRSDQPFFWEDDEDPFDRLDRQGREAF